MKLRSIFAGALALVLSASVAIAQPSQGSSPLTIAKGGTNAITASAARTNLGVAIGSNVQAWDADLDCLAANATAGVLARTGAGTCAARTLTAPAAGFTITNPAGTAGDPTFVLANDLAALEALASTGFAVRTGTDAWAQRTLTAPAAGFTITNPAGVAGNPTFVLANDLAALEGLSANGIAVRTTTDTWAQRTVTGTANAICVTNGDGVSGNPTLDICSGFLSTAHSWAGVQTFAAPIFTGITDNQGLLKLSAFVTSTQITAAQNNYTATDGSNTCTAKLVLRISSDASRNVTGLSCAQAEGDIRIIHNVGAFSIVLTNQDAGSTAANRFLFGGDMTLLLDTSVTIRYDGVASRWRAITTPGAGGGGGGTVSSVTIAGAAGITTSGTCTITTSGTCTVAQDGSYSGWALKNCTLAASVASNILTVALKDNTGADPSATSPCSLSYRNATLATGSTTLVAQTAALSITTNATGATLGSVNSVAFRFWVVSFNNAGTNVLALINCSTPSTVFPLDEGTIAASTAMSASATAAGVFYTPNGTSVSSKMFRILGYVEYSSGLATAGTYASAPTIVQSFGPGIRRPGEVVQSIYKSITGMTTTTNTYAHSNTAPVAANGGLLGSQAITPAAASNHVRVRASVVESNSASGPYGFAFLTTSAPATLATSANTFPGTAGYITVPIYYEGIFGSASAVTFNLYGSAGSGTTTFNGVSGAAEFGGTSSSFIHIEEIMS